jgi:hypothetical protein
MVRRLDHHGRQLSGAAAVSTFGRALVCGGSLLGATALAACRGSDARPPLAGGEATLEALARTIWAAAVRGDTAALERVRLTEREHNGTVWPELPAARPEVGFPVDLAWENIELRNRAERSRMLAALRDSELTLHGVECRGETRRFESFHVLTDCVIVLEGSGGILRTVQPVEDVLVIGGQHKIFRYYAD